MKFDISCERFAPAVTAALFVFFRFSTLQHLCKLQTGNLTGARHFIAANCKNLDAKSSVFDLRPMQRKKGAIFPVVKASKELKSDQNFWISLWTSFITLGQY